VPSAKPIRGAGYPATTANSIASSERVRLAQTALAAALSVPGVVRGDSGRLHAHATPVPGAEPLPGVVCAALAGGGYEVTLRLVAELVPLQTLAQRVAERVRRRAAAAGLGPALKEIGVHFADIESGLPAA
jgi:hypothetical protein